MFILSKCSKYGECFGFVRFYEVKNFHKLQQVIDDVWMRPFKLRGSLDKFARNQNAIEFFSRSDSEFG